MSVQKYIFGDKISGCGGVRRLTNTFPKTVTIKLDRVDRRLTSLFWQLTKDMQKSEG